MTFEDVSKRGLVLLGCGKMGSAMLAGWLDGGAGAGLPPASVHVIDPMPSDWLRGTGVAINAGLPVNPAIVLIAVKPQMMAEALPAIGGFGSDTLFISVAAGTPIRAYEAALGADAVIVRAMPNTPAAIGRGITAIVGNAQADEAALALAETLLQAVGQTVRLEVEAQMDAVTAVSGSGPAYVFHLIEAMTEAGIAEGLGAELALKLARATVAGAGDLAERSDESPAQLRVNVTSPGGTTAAALAVLMDDQGGFPPLVKRAIKAAADRSRELGG